MLEANMAQQMRTLVTDVMKEVKNALGNINSNLNTIRLDMATQANQIRYLESVVRPPEEEYVLSDGEGGAMETSGPGGASDPIETPDSTSARIHSRQRSKSREGRRRGEASCPPAANRERGRLLLTGGPN